ncbi:MAG: TatD family hydrolase [Candidatus Bathyarchaeota archaeon]|nr:TatD family hydrolase [Candidatus Bathyarchaeota archaeon]MDH5733885.1 TatD family hydrolase [Candidatus Bathyarchaeota archaeon]
MLVDTHAHLQWATFDKDREKAIRRAKKAGVKYIINIGFDIDGSKRAIELAEKHKELYATVGIHPHNASQFNPKVLDKLRELSENPKVVAIGEIGLDYYRNLSPKQAQKKAFEAQLFLTKELELPVVIHDREAHADTLKMLSKFKEKINVVMHCFSGSREMAEDCVQSNFHISFAGPVTFPNSYKLQDIAKWVDLNKMVLETDSPWLAPQEMRGKRNEPAFLPFIARKIAALKGISVDELAKATTGNAQEIFQLF